MERITTNIFSRNTAEHLHRYALTFAFVTGKDVLDIACGEGYGSHLMSKYAKTVRGVDIDQESVDKANAKYNSKNLSYTKGDVRQIPFSDQSFDVVVSFETIEHLTEHESMMIEIKRVLKNDGLLIISSPERENYSEKADFNNPFHLKELNKSEFEELVGKYFRNLRCLSQSMVYGSLIAEDSIDRSSDMDIFSGNFEAIEKIGFPGKAYYYILIASDQPIKAINQSVFYLAGLLEYEIKWRQNIYRNSIPFRLGSFLLSPIKLIMRIFNKK